ncbi:flagellar biosynthetic protein FliO [Lignipirellula cremea]|uniref:Flagellar biosynthesis protein, FliO n=1 Tax=Lignipirellula cremea TaxID=2528010 RepID=A0A518E0I9_9BACT|nr:flagellar biosynthetic protein FliO [Lignipirellula cremea]QDU97597.1 Flagellar biosynthesis protein, FliO [Lignipirellula cremea]
MRGPSITLSFTMLAVAAALASGQTTTPGAYAAPAHGGAYSGGSYSPQPVRPDLPSTPAGQPTPGPSAPYGGAAEPTGYHTPAAGQGAEGFRSQETTSPPHGRAMQGSSLPGFEFSQQQAPPIRDTGVQPAAHYEPVAEPGHDETSHDEASPGEASPGEASPGEASPGQTSSRQTYHDASPAVPVSTGEAASQGEREPPRLQSDGGGKVSRPSIPLARKGERPDGDSVKSPSTPGGAALTVFGSLALVIGLFLGLAWFSRRAGGKSNLQLPREVVEVLGRAPLTTRQNLQVVRFGNKLLLLSVTPGGSETLTEITDPEEIDRIAGLCQQQQPDSISESFRNVLSQFGSEPAPGGWWSSLTGRRKPAGRLDQLEA